MLPYGERSASRDQVLGGFSTALAIDEKFLPLRPCLVLTTGGTAIGSRTVGIRVPDGHSTWRLHSTPR